MKIKNDLISIKIGDNQYDFNNLILDEYLKKFINTQLNIDENKKTTNRKSLTYLLIKFDTPLNDLNEKSVLVNEDFNIFSIDCTINQEVSENSIITQYNYKIKDVIDFSSSDYPNMKDINEYKGRKITAIGFNSFGGKSTSIYTNVKAVLDVSNYNIYIQENQNFTITRKDIITTDSIFYSNNKSKIKAPLHLMPKSNEALIKQNKIYNEDMSFWREGLNESYGILYSIGLSSYFNRIDKEFVIGKDIEVIQNETEIQINDINNLLSKYTEYLRDGLYPRTGLYPLQSNYKFLILKYKVWQNILSGTYDEPIYTMTDTGYYYYQAIPITVSGKLKLKIKYERG